MFTVVNNGLQPVNPLVTFTLQSCHFDILIILHYQLSPHPHPSLDFNVQVHWCMCVGGYHVYPNLYVNYEVMLYMVTLCQVTCYINTAILTQQGPDVDRGTPWSASGTPLGN